MPLRTLRAFLALALLGVATASHALVFAVNEGVTYRVTNDEIRAKYAGLAADLGKILKQPVSVEPIGDYPTLRKGLETKEYDLAFVHPAHLSVLAIRDSGYRLLAVTKGFQSYTANFLVRADSPLKTLTDLKGTSLGAPDEDSITSWMVRATLRDALGDPKQVSLVYTRYQDAVPFFVEHNLTRSGATASNAVVKALVHQGRAHPRQVEAGADQAHAGQLLAQRRAGAEGSRVPARPRRHRRGAQEARADQVRGIRALRRTRHACDRQVARAVEPGADRSAGQAGEERRPYALPSTNRYSTRITASPFSAGKV